MLHALEQIRRMRGGAQSHLMRCSDGSYYVVKFQNNPQHRRILVNELLGTRLARRLGLPTTPVAIVEVSEELIRLTPELSMELARSRIPCQHGLQFASLYPRDPRYLTLHDFLPDRQLRELKNLHDFAGMLVFAKWTCNTNGRQTVFFREEAQRGAAHLRDAPQATGDAGPGDGQTEDQADGADDGYKTLMIDQGFCFNAGEWNFPDAPLRGRYARNRVYEGVTRMESFGPWIRRVETVITDKGPDGYCSGDSARMVRGRLRRLDAAGGATPSTKVARAGLAACGQEHHASTIPELEMNR
jgi:hypothetical protein